MGKKNGWGAARDGKVHTESDAEYSSFNSYKTNVKSSKDLKGLYGKYQGKTLGGKDVR